MTASSLHFERFSPVVPVDGAWTASWVEPGFEIGDAIASWAAETPPGSHIEVELQARTPVGFETGWYALGHWASADDSFHRTSVPDQADEFGTVETDVFRATAPLDAYRLRVTLVPGEGGTPSLRSVTAITGGAASGGTLSSPPDPGAATELAVPAYAQSIHASEYPEVGGGGAAWCSPTATAMVIAFWGTGPTPEELAWVDPAYPDPWVAHAARATFDHAYRGTGNWPFNTAYAASFGLDAFVTRLRSFREAELFLEAGIPLVASIATGPGELEGFLLSQGTDGHLVVIRGFTAEGDPIANDPAAGSNDAVRRVYDRAQFERAWLGGSGGIVYVIRRPDVPLPPSPGNW